MDAAAVSQGWFGPASPLFARFRRRAAAGRPTVIGHVLSAGVVERAGPDGSPQYAAEVRFLYNVHARTREGRWTSAAGPERAAAEALAARHARGTKPRVAYDPADPSRAELAG